MMRRRTVSSISSERVSRLTACSLQGRAANPPGPRLPPPDAQRPGRGRRIVSHFTAVADASPIPVILYSVTSFTGVNLSPEAVERLAAHPNVVGIKESGSDIGQIAEYVARTPDEFSVLAGSATTLVHALAAGCDGAILAVAALVPDMCAAMRALVRDGRLVEARALQRRLMPLARSVGGA